MIYTVRNGVIVPKREIIKPIAPARLRRRLPDTGRLRFPHVWVPVYIPETMAVAFDAKATSVVSTTGGSPATITNNNLTVGVGATLLIAEVNLGDFNPPGLTATCTGLTWNGVAMTLIATKNDPGTSGGTVQCNAYGLVNPASGNHSLVASFGGTPTGNTGYYVDCFSFKGSDATSVANAVPAANVILDASATMLGIYPTSPFSVTTASGDAAVASMNTWNAASPGANVGTLINSANPENGCYGSIYALALTVATSLQFNGANSPSCGIAFRIVQAGSTPAAATVASSVLSMMGVG